jgi:hypothetical protein
MAAAALNRGDGSFSPETVLAQEGFLGSTLILPGDFDGDGAVDLAVGGFFNCPVCAGGGVALEILFGSFVSVLFNRSGPPASQDQNRNRIPDECEEGAFRRGDANADGAADLSDAAAILGHLFLGEAAAGCEKSADADDNGFLEVTDAVFLLLHLFLGGPAPPQPFPDCGLDPTRDPLSCRPQSCL